MKLCPALILAALAMTSACPNRTYGDDRFASRVVRYSNLGSIYPEYRDPLAALGKPTTWIKEPGLWDTPAGTYACSLVYGAHNTAPDFMTDLITRNLVTTVGTPQSVGEIVVEFDKPIANDPDNWFGQDFIVFGNAAFIATEPVTFSSDMEVVGIDTGDIIGEQLTVSVSQYEDGPWFDYAAPKADNYWPTNAFAWDRTNHTWSGELDWTKPVNHDPSQVLAEFGGKSVADGIDLYCGSAGGTAYDIGQFGLDWIKYVKVSGKAAEIDAVVRVSSKRLSVGAVKRMEDGIPVSLDQQVVTAGTAEMGNCFYIESADRSGGIRVTGKTAELGKLATVTGVLATVDGERELQATWLATADGGSVAPLGMPNKQVGGANFHYQSGPPKVGQQGVRNGTGLNNTGLLVRTWGKVKTPNSGAGTFTIDDGSAAGIECTAPDGVTLPEENTYVAVTGISSCKKVAGELIPVIRVRIQGDIQ